MWENRKLYNPLSSETVSTFRGNENYIDCAAVNFLLSLLNSTPGFLRYPVSLCLSVTLLSKYLFFDPPTQTLCEVIRCSH